MDSAEWKFAVECICKTEITHADVMSLIINV